MFGFIINTIQASSLEYELIKNGKWNAVTGKNLVLDSIAADDQINFGNKLAWSWRIPQVCHDISGRRSSVDVIIISHVGSVHRLTVTVPVSLRYVLQPKPSF